MPDGENLYTQLSRARILAEIESQRQQLKRQLPVIEEAAGDSPQQNYLALSLYVLLGDSEGHRQRAEMLCAGDAAAYQHWGMGHALRFLAGECTDERIREAELTVAGSKYDECVLRTAIGERLLVLGQREKAKEQFAKCVDKGTPSPDVPAGRQTDSRWSVPGHDRCI